jgi:hypothetical protein
MTSQEAADQGYEYLAQILAQHDLSTACMKIVGRSPDYVENFKVALHIKHEFEPERIKRITTSLIQDIVVRAKQSEGGEFNLLCGNTLVALCGGLESLVKDVVAASLLEDERLVERLRDQKLRISVSDALASDAEERARFIVDILYTEEGAKLGQAERFMRLLKSINRDTDVKLDDNGRNNINEAFEIRNAIVHRGSRFDRRLKLKMPHFDQAVGTPIDVGETRFRAYRNSIMQFSGEIACWNL